MPRVLHLPCSYLPWTIGGKESFTHSLARLLTELGWESHVVFHQNPAYREPLGRNEFEGIPVHVLPPLVIRRENVYACTTQEVPGFAELLGELKPDVVHFQDFSSGANLHHLALARAVGAKTVMSYHTPGQSCLQRELLQNGQNVCDGQILLDRCTACRLGTQGIPRLVRWPLSKLSLPLSGESQLARALTARRMTELFARAWKQLVEQIDHIHVHAAWVKEVLRLNHVPPEKVTFFRIGLPFANTLVAARKPRDVHDPLRLIMVGRCERIKGQRVLIDAVRGLPASVNVTVTFIGPAWDQSDYGRTCLELIRGDRRFEPPRRVPHQDMPQVLAEADVLVAPSLWLETGPLVVLEAFGAGLPVLGSNLGGIAELVQDGQTGFLFEPGSAEQLRNHILKLVTEPGLLDSLRSKLEPPRTMRQVAVDMIKLYQSITA
jgi:glycosyltransferase involved in cell wall biosynthesis